MKSRARGFTLLELLVAIAILAIILTAVYGTLDATLLAKRVVQDKLEVASIGQSILRIMARDIRGAFATAPDQPCFVAQNNEIDGARADVLDFISSVDSTVDEVELKRSKPSGISEIRYRFKKSELADGDSSADQPYLSLFRSCMRVGIDQEDDRPSSGGYQLVHNRIKSLKLEFLSAETGPAEGWHSVDQAALPVAVRIELALWEGRRGKDIRTFTETVIIPTGGAVPEDDDEDPDEEDDDDDDDDEVAEDEE